MNPVGSKQEDQVMKAKPGLWKRFWRLFAPGAMLMLWGVKQAVAVVPTPLNMDFYGDVEGGVSGDRIVALCADAIPCGEYELKSDGSYGFIHVYGDDPQTAEIEGAKPGDSITFRLNDEPLDAVDGGSVTWLGDGERRQVNLRRTASSVSASAVSSSFESSSVTGGGGGSPGLWFLALPAFLPRMLKHNCRAAGGAA